MSNSGRRPHIILLILDSVRAANMSCYGYPVKTTPRLDNFAEQNTLFQRAFTTSTWTIPTHASLLSGLFLRQHGLENAEGNRRFHESVVTLPEALRGSGYATAAFSQNPLFSPLHQLGAGFDTFRGIDELLESRSLTRPLTDSNLNQGRSHFHNAARYLRKVISPRALLAAAYDWFEEVAAQAPAFLMINVINAHQPWAPPADILIRTIDFHPKYLLDRDFTGMDQWRFNSGKRKVTKTHCRVWRSLYDASIRHVDRVVGAFLNRLTKLSGWANTIVIVTADHGELIGEYQGITGHTLSLHDHILHVPMILRHPDYRRRLRVEGVIQILNLYPSILEWAGVEAAAVPSAQLQCLPLSQAMESAADASGFAFAEEDYSGSYDVLGGLLGMNPDMDSQEYPRRQVGVRTVRHKYIWRDEHPAQLFDLGNDPGEEHDLLQVGTPESKDALDIATELHRVLESWSSRLEVFAPQTVEAGFDRRDSDLRKRLEELGYLHPLES